MLLASEHADHLRDDELLLYVEGRLTDAQFGTANGHLAHCTDCQGHLREAAATKIGADKAAVAAERRREPRFPVMENATMRVLSPFDQRLHEAQITNLSGNGTRIRIPMELPQGALIQIRLKGLLVLGEIRYCTEQQSFFYAGLRIRDVL